MIRLARPTTGPEEAEAVREVLCSDQPWLTNGPRVEEFEARCKAYLGADRAVVVANATAGLQLAFEYYAQSRRVNLVYMPSFTFVATANAAYHAGLEICFVDIDPATLQMSPETLLKAVGQKDRAMICPVLYGGLPRDVEPLEDAAAQLKMPLVWDAAHAFGSAEPRTLRRVGATSNPAVFSFYPSKNLTTAEGGLLATSDPDLEDWAIRGRNQGQTKEIWKQGAGESWDVVLPGYNFRMSELHAAVGLVQLRHYDAALTRRRDVTRRLREALKAPLLFQITGPWSNDHLLAARAPELVHQNAREAFVTAMLNRGVEVGVQYPPVHLMRAFWRYTKRLPVTEDWGRQVVTLPNHHGLTDAEVDTIIRATQETCEELWGT